MNIIKPAEAKKEMENGAVLLDVREKEEVQFTSIEPKIWIPLQELPERHKELPDKKILCICRTGGRSASATEFLRSNGYDAYNVWGGINAWHDKVDPKIKKYFYIKRGESLKIQEIKNTT